MHAVLNQTSRDALSSSWHGLRDPGLYHTLQVTPSFKITDPEQGDESYGGDTNPGRLRLPQVELTKSLMPLWPCSFRACPLERTFGD